MTPAFYDVKCFPIFKTKNLKIFVFIVQDSYVASKSPVTEKEYSLTNLLDAIDTNVSKTLLNHELIDISAIPMGNVIND